MKTLGLTFLLFCLFLIQSYSQSVDLELRKNENFDKVLHDINNAKDIEDTLRVQLISELNRLVTELDFPRDLIFGKEEQFLQKGMSKNFKREPKQVKTTVDRIAKVVELENKHIELYAADYNLRVLESLYDGVLSLKTKSIDLGIDSSYSNSRMYDRIVHISMSGLGGSYRQHLNEPNINLTKRNKFTAPQISYPYDGQLNFYIDSYTQDYGYIISSDVMEEILESFNLKAKWTNTRGEFVYTDMYYDSRDEIQYMRIPKSLLQPDNLYKLEIVSFDSDQIEYGRHVDEFYRYLINRNPKFITQELKTSKVLTSIYFRTSIYRTLEEKIKDGQNYFKLNEDYKVSISMREPFSIEEIEQGNSQKSLITFEDSLATSSHDVAYDVKPYYYLNYPKFETIDTNKYEQKLKSEIDHTISAEYIKKMKMTNIYRASKLMMENLTSDSIKIPQVIDQDVELTYSMYGPRITKELFESKSLKLKPATLHIGFPNIQYAVEKLTLLQEAIMARIEERAKFYQYADIVFSKRKGDRKRKKYEEYLLKEQENLPAELKEILKLDAQKFDLSHIDLYIDYYMPGFNTTISSELTSVLLK